MAGSSKLVTVHGGEQLDGVHHKAVRMDTTFSIAFGCRVQLCWGDECTLCWLAPCQFNPTLQRVGRDTNRMELRCFAQQRHHNSRSSLCSPDTSAQLLSSCCTPSFEMAAGAQSHPARRRWACPLQQQRVERIVVGRWQRPPQQQ